MKRSMFSFTTFTVALVTMTGCGISPVTAPIAYGTGAAPAIVVTSQAKSGTRFNEVSSLDPADKRAKGALDAYFEATTVVLRMQPRNEDRMVLNAWLSKLAARPVGRGATEFVTQAVLNGGMIPHSFESHRLSRTLRFTVNADGRIKAFEHLTPEAFFGFRVAPPAFKPLLGETPGSLQADFTKALTADRRLGAFLNLPFQLALTGENPDSRAVFAKAVMLDLPEGTLFRVHATWKDRERQLKSTVVDLFRNRSGRFTGAVQADP